MDSSTHVANEPVLLRSEDSSVITLTLNRPRQLNALSEELLGELQAGLDRIAEDRSVRAVVIAGNGKAFCAGHDLREMRAHPRREYYENLFAACSRLMLAITRLPQPVIARVHGLATAAGCQLVAACDLAVASRQARFAVSGIDVGLFCSTPSVPLSRNVARKHAFEMLVTGEFIDAEQALREGLVNRVVDAGDLDSAVAELTEKIRSKSRVALEIGKRAFYRQLEQDLQSAYGCANEAMAENMMTADAVEGIDAFLEKRDPQWRD